MEINPKIDLWDALIVGGGPAGLSAALALARWCRRVAVASCERPGRADWPQVNHNYLGFPDGVPARELVQRGREQAERYGARIYDLEIASLSRDDEDGIFKGQARDFALRARAVLLATGVRDRWVEFPGYETFIGRSLHWCIVCDGYEMRDRQVVVAGNDEHTAEMAIQMLRFTPHVTVATNSGSLGMRSETIERLDRHAVRLVVGRIGCGREIEGEPGMLAALKLESGEEIEAEHLFSVQGAEPRTALAASLGVPLTPDGYVEVDIEGKTAVPGVYAAGDVTKPLAHQIAAAVHEGATAANALNYYLFEKDEEAFQAARGLSTA